MGRLFSVLICGVLLLSGCSRDDSGGGTSPDGVTVLFWAGGLKLDVGTRATDLLTQGTTLRVVAFKRSNAGVAADVTQTPTYINSYVVGSDGSLSPVVVDQNGDVTDGTATAQMRVATNGVYDFYAFANALPFIEGSTNVSNISNGMDFMVGSYLNVTISVGGNSSVVVPITLNHLGSRVNFTAAPSQALKEEESITSFTVDSVVWDKISSSADLTLNPLSNPQALIVSGNTGRYALKSFRTAAGVTPNFEVNGSGVTLPYPVAVVDGKNVIDMIFGLRVNGAQAVAFANNVEVPEFKPGYSYTFALSLGRTIATLSLVITGTNVPDNWVPVTMETVIGSGGVMLTLGSWSVTSWDSSLGTGGASLSLGPWTPTAWSSTIGSGGASVTLSQWIQSSWNSQMGESGNFPGRYTDDIDPNLHP